MPSKVETALEALKIGPMKAAIFRNSLGSSSYRRVCKSGSVEVYTDENYEYAEGRRGQSAMCLWVRLTDKPYTAGTGNGNKIRRSTLSKYVEILKRQGYTVTPPDFK